MPTNYLWFLKDLKVPCKTHQFISQASQAPEVFFQTTIRCQCAAFFLSYVAGHGRAPFPMGIKPSARGPSPHICRQLKPIRTTRDSQVISVISTSTFETWKSSLHFEKSISSLANWTHPNQLIHSALWGPTSICWRSREKMAFIKWGQTFPMDVPKSYHLTIGP